MITRAVPTSREGRRLRATRLRRADSTRLTFSLSIVSERAIASLAPFERSWPRRPLAQDPAGIARNHLYAIGRFVVDESEWAARADHLDAGIASVLDRLESSGVPALELCRSDVHVRAYFTLPPGAETIRADTVERLSAVNATLWLDASA